MPKETYHAIHVWILRKFGAAQFCQNQKCEAKSNKYEWALIHGKEYARNQKNFLWLCKKCHTNYDLRKFEIKSRGRGKIVADKTLSAWSGAIRKNN